MRFLLPLLIAATLSFAQGASAIASTGGSVTDATDTTSADKAVFTDINIFAQMPLGAVLVLWSNFDLSLEIKEKITNHSFVMEPYYMQNIDREQFEQKRILHLFEEQKRAFFKLFPDEED
ncbi:MAG: hypothetical protein LBC85_11870 [Fibromonadaceae bacterium]|jgi:hypothetical protein|nr:hypothetical protein [Fibromonadaceae bacterium]